VGVLKHARGPMRPSTKGRGPGLTGEERRAALLSVYAHAYAAERERDVPSMSVKDAAEHLREDVGELAEARRRRAIAKVAAAGVDRYRDALVRLDTDTTVDRIRAVLDLHPGAKPLVKEILVYNLLLAQQGDPIPWCMPTYPITTVIDDGTAVEATVHLAVHRDLKDLAEVSDPQHWHDCSVFFEQSYVADRNSNSKYPSGCGPDPARKKRAPGSPWPDVLFEHFKLDWKLPEIQGSWFKNLLCIDPLSTAQYGYRYRLHTSLCSEVLGCKQNGGLGIDEGHFELTGGVSPVSAWTFVEAVKRVKFSARKNVDQKTLDTWAWILLWAMGDEVADAACCKCAPSKPVSWHRRAVNDKARAR